MRRKLFTAAVLFSVTAMLAGAGDARADEKDGKSQGGPPPGKGWRKYETPPAPTPAPKGKFTPQPTPKPKAKTPAPAPPKEEGIGKYVSAWAHQGIHGTQLAAKIHQ